MSEPTPVRVPDIGDFTDVPIIEIHVSPGDEVAVEDPLVTLESDKATMDVPAPMAGTVSQLCVQIGDRVSEGSVLLSLERDGAAPTDTEPEQVIPLPIWKVTVVPLTFQELASSEWIWPWSSTLTSGS